MLQIYIKKMGKQDVFLHQVPPIFVGITLLLILEKKFSCIFGKFVPPLLGGKFQFTVYTTSSSTVFYFLKKVCTSTDKNHS